MNIQTKLARVIEANRISGVKAYGEGEYMGGVTNVKVQMLMHESVKHGRELDKLLAKNWVQGFDGFIEKLTERKDQDPHWEDHL